MAANAESRPGTQSPERKALPWLLVGSGFAIAGVPLVALGAFLGGGISWALARRGLPKNH